MGWSRGQCRYNPDDLCEQFDKWYSEAPPPERVLEQFDQLNKKLDTILKLLGQPSTSTDEVFEGHQPPLSI